MKKNENKELSVSRLSDKIFVINGRYFEEHMTAVAAGNGLVIIDTLTTAADTLRAWKLIEEFCCEPVRYVINTHADLDHYAGNQLFPDAAIIGHQNFKNHFDYAIFRDRKNIEEIEKFIKQAEEQYEKMKPGSKEAAIWNRYANDYRVLLEGFDGYTFTPPKLYISGDIELALGDTIIEVKHLGPGHTDADMFVMIPGEKVMISGDLVVGKDYIPVVHAIHGGSVENLIRILKELLKMDGNFDTIVPGHGKLTDFSAVRSQLTYLESLKEAVDDARGKKLSFEEAQETIKMEEYRYHYLYDFVHMQNLENAWNEYENNK